MEWARSWQHEAHLRVWHCYLMSGGGVRVQSTKDPFYNSIARLLVTGQRGKLVEVLINAPHRDNKSYRSETNEGNADVAGRHGQAQDIDLGRGDAIPYDRDDTPADTKSADGRRQQKG